MQNLSAEITKNIRVFMKLKEQCPDDIELSEALQKMYDALEKAQGTEWEEQVKEYIEAKKSLDLARSFAQSALEDLSKVVNAVTAINNAFEKFNKALSSVV